MLSVTHYELITEYAVSWGLIKLVIFAAALSLWKRLGTFAENHIHLWVCFCLSSIDLYVFLSFCLDYYIL